MEENIQKIILDSLDNYDKNKIDLGTFIKKELELNNYDANKVNEVYSDIDTTINELHESFLDISKKSTSTHIWFKNKINNVLNRLPDDLKQDFSKEVTKALYKQNNEIFKILYNTDIPKEFGSNIENSYDFNDDVKANHFAKEFVDKDVQNNVFLNSEYLVKNINEDFLKRKDISIVKEYFENDLHNEKDKDLKKLVALSLEKNKSRSDILKEKNPIEISAIVDNVLTVGKIIHKYSKNESKLDMFSLVKDKAISSITTLASIVVKKYASQATGKIGAMIGSVFGPTGTVVGAMVGKAVGVVAGLATESNLLNSFKSFANVGKNIISSKWEKLASPLIEGGKKLLSMIFG